jgi:acyl dehydratase
MSASGHATGVDDAARAPQTPNAAEDKAGVGAEAGEALVQYLEDFAVGQRYGSGRLRIDEEQIKIFAAEFDPQPFHLADDAGRRSILGGLAASGWHTAALTMRLLVESELKPAGGIVGVGFDELLWPRPVRPGDELRVESEILEVRPSRSRPGQGLIKARTTTLNQDGNPVQVLVSNLIVSRREPQSTIATNPRKSASKKEFHHERT